MVTVEEALSLVDNNSTCSEKTTSINTQDALGHVLAQDTFSLIDMPSFNQSAMDGYAINYDENATSYQLIGEVAAGGNFKNITINKGEAVRIFTGAAVPNGVNMVVRQEDANPLNNEVAFAAFPDQWGNIRNQGEQSKKGELALKKGHQLTPAGVGYLLGLGIHQIEIFQKPSVLLLVTGDELTKPGLALEEGKIYESNSFMLISALKESGIIDCHCVTIKDNYQDTVDNISTGIDKYDVVLISGGISVGDYDFVSKALQEIKVQEIFYKVLQQPGKPLYFGKKNDKFIFALPGNPAAALTSFYIYVLRLLHKKSGLQNGLPETQATLKHPYSKKGNRGKFLKAHVYNNQVQFLDAQSSAMLKSFALANAIGYVPSDVDKLQEGEDVKVYLLP